MKKINKFLINLIVIAALLVGCGSGGSTVSEAADKKTSSEDSYGVFIGANPEDMGKMAAYETVVIDAQYYTKEEVKKLQKDGHKVFSYINVGSLENFRDYYDDYKHLSLGVYENWEDECWIDVSDKGWQDFVVQKMAAGLVDKGIDGFFVDNTDVYYYHQSEEIFMGLTAILKSLKSTGKYVCINGGDAYITEYTQRYKSPKDVADAINQESVFSEIDWDHSSFTKKSAEDSQYFQDYVELAADKGLDIYLLEYTKDKALIKEIKSYCAKHGFKYYISSSLELN